MSSPSNPRASLVGVVQLLEFWRRALQGWIGPVPRSCRQGAEREATGSFLVHGLEAEILHAARLGELQVEVAALDGPVHLEAEAQAGILDEVHVDLLRQGLQLVGVQVDQGDLLHCKAVEGIRGLLGIAGIAGGIAAGLQQELQQDLQQLLHRSCCNTRAGGSSRPRLYCAVPSRRDCTERRLHRIPEASGSSGAWDPHDASPEPAPARPRAEQRAASQQTQH